jgi:hypothetical protein
MIVEYKINITLGFANEAYRDEWVDRIKTAIQNAKPTLPVPKYIFGRKNESVINSEITEGW